MPFIAAVFADDITEWLLPAIGYRLQARGGGQVHAGALPDGQLMAQWPQITE